MSLKNYISKEVLTNGHKLAIEIVEIENSVKSAIEEILFKDYLTVKRYEFPLYYFISEKVEIQDENAWKWIEKFIDNDSAVMFFEQNDDDRFLEFKNGKDITTILSTSFIFTFYLTNRKCDFLLAYNQHDYLICSGKAEKWLLEYIHSLNTKLT